MGYVFLLSVSIWHKRKLGINTWMGHLLGAPHVVGIKGIVFKVNLPSSVYFSRYCNYHPWLVIVNHD